MSLRKTFETDQEAEVNGKWFVVGVYEDDGSEQRVKLARMGKANKKYLADIERRSLPHRAAIDNNRMPEALGTRLMHEAFSETVLLDWDNIRESEWTGNDDDKTPRKFTPENARELFKALPAVYDDWAERARSASNYRLEELKAEGKN